jgi:hypothetical protein
MNYDASEDLFFFFFLSASPSSADLFLLDFSVGSGVAAADSADFFAAFA